jgi:hypothetical protein
MVPTVAVGYSPGDHAVTRRRRLSIAACALLAVTVLGALVAPGRPSAQNSCRATCWEGYGACYKATNSRQRCQQHLQRCLNGCIRKK